MVRRLLLLATLAVTGALVLAACGGDDDSESAPAAVTTEEVAPEPAPTEPASAEDAVASFCASLDNLESTLNEYEALDSDTGTRDEVRAVNEQVETAFADVVDAAQELPELDLTTLEEVKDSLLLSVDVDHESIDKPGFAATNAKSLALITSFEIDDLRSESC